MPACKSEAIIADIVARIPTRAYDIMKTALQSSKVLPSWLIEAIELVLKDDSISYTRVAALLEIFEWSFRAQG